MHRYRQLLAVAAVLIFFSGVDVYISLGLFLGISPKNWVAVLALLALPLVVGHLHRPGKSERRLGRIAIWSSTYLAVSLVWYSILPSDAAAQELQTRLLCVCLIPLMGFLFIAPESRKAAGIAIIAVSLLTIVINVVELAQPGWFLVQVPERASGLYLNANSCAAALVMGMIIGGPLIPLRLRLPFYLLIGFGVALTFSRSNIIGWVMALAILVTVDSVKTGVRELVFSGLAAAMLLLVLLGGAMTGGFLNDLNLGDNQLNRVTFFRTLDADDRSTGLRRDLAAKAWETFAASPFRGNGLGSTMNWNEQASTHNMFLYFMADHGVIGAFILPTLLMCVFMARPKVAPGAHWAFCAFIFWYAFFSHNIFTERHQLLAFAFFAMGGVGFTGIEPVASRARQGGIARSTAADARATVGVT